jgi:SNF2 family DNA or RNA helicase/uncharacterized Zn finger protein
MARKQYGTTWWGQQWLNALNDIDYSNRLPRGRSYANKGAARDIQINDNKITAKVQGSRRSPYKVNISIPVFTGGERAKILGIITENPLLLSQLLNRELPSGLNQALLQEGIRIFPRAWKDVNGGCSCPDWAVPCKHMASVLYLVANEIDKNPFLVFQLKGFDIIKGLEGIGFSVSEEQEAAITTFDKLIATPSEEEIIPEWDELTYQELDFSIIPDCRENLMTILSDRPVFYPEGAFKPLLARSYNFVAKSITKFNKSKEELNLTAEMPATEKVEIILNDNLQVKTITLRDIQGKLLSKFEEKNKFIDFLLLIPPNQLEFLSPALRGIYTAFQFAKKLGEQSAYIPQLLENGKHYLVRWLPANLNTQVATTSDLITKLIPKEVIYYKQPKTIKVATEADNFNALMSFFINHFVKNYHNLQQKIYNKSIPEMFFDGTVEQFATFETREYSNAIQQWLSRFYIGQKDYVPVIQVEDINDEFEIKIAINDKTKPTQAPVSIEDIFAESEYKGMRMSVLRDLAMLIEYFPKLNNILSTQGKARLFFSPVDFVNVLFKILPTIRLFGIEILMPKALRKLLRPQMSLSIEGGDSGVLEKKSSIVGLDEMLKFKWQIAIGNNMVTKEEFLKMLQQFSGIVKINDEFIYFNENEISKLIDRLENPPTLNQHEIFQAALTEEYDGAKIQLDKATRDLMKKLLGGDETELPAGLLATLRPYQLRGYEWMYKNSRLGLGSIIADDMGLGKTLQVITTLLRLKEDGEINDQQKGLIIVPTTLLTNWSKEIMKFAPTLKWHIYHGVNRDLTPLQDADVLITTYGIARNETAKLQKQKWLTVIIDEAQNIKNPTTAQSKAIKKIKAPVRIAMSGTPVENRLSEYWSIFDYINKGYLGTLSKFKDKYARPIEIDRDKQQLNHFLKVTSPFIMRRLKTDKSIIDDLPDKIEKDDYCLLTKEQTAIYQNVIDTTMKKVEESTGIERRGMVLKLITALKQVCNHPRQFLKKGKGDAAISGKAMFLMDLLQQILDRNEKVLVFTQYREMGLMMAKMIEDEFGLNAPFLHGALSRKQRDEMVEDFQNNRNTKIFLLSLKAAGTGLNLTAANNVIHYDLWWNPAVEAQATDRAYRIGQKQKVMVHRFITQGTFEEKINKLIQSKKELADLTVSTSEKWIGEFSNSELRELVKLG